MKAFFGEFDISTHIEKAISQTSLQLDQSRTDETAIVEIETGNWVNFIAAYLACRRTGRGIPLIGRARRPNGPGAAPTHHVNLHISTHANMPEVSQLKSELSHNLIDLGVIARTSGSTLDSKSVLWGKAGIKHQVRVTRDRIQYPSQARVLFGIPPWSAYGLILLEICEEYHFPIVLPDRFHSGHVASAIHKHQVTALEGSPSLFSNLLTWVNSFDTYKQTFESVETWGCGGEVLPRSVLEAWSRSFAAPILDGYGLCEAGPNVAVSGPSEWKYGTVGKALDSVDLRVASDGELLVKSPSNMLGYWSPVGDHSYQIGDWLATGDMAEIDSDGYVSIKGRKSDAISVDGRKVAPSSIEHLLWQEHEVSRSIAIGIPNGARGEAIVIFIEDSINNIDTTHIAQSLSRVLDVPVRPKHVLRVQKFPVLANGKIHRSALRVEAALRLAEKK